MEKIEIRPIAKKWFDETIPQNYKPYALATIGESPDTGVISVASADMTSVTKIKVVIAATASHALDVALAEGVITITLGTTSADPVEGKGTADNAKNTAALIIEEINDIVGYTSVVTTSGYIATETSEDIIFVDGQYGTPCPEIGTCLMKVVSGTDTYYVSTKADNSRYNNAWKSFTLTDM